jgi:hypothetical protein
VRGLLDDPDVDVAQELRRQPERLRGSAGRLLRMAEEIDRPRRARAMGMELDPQGVAADSEEAMSLAEEHRLAIDRRAEGLASWLRHAIVANAERSSN